MPEEASETCVSVARQGVETIVLTTGTIGKADPPVTPVKEPVVREGDARRRAAARVQDVCRTCNRRLGVDDPRLGRERRAKLLEARRGPEGCAPRSERQDAGGACLGQRLAALPAQDRAQGPPRAEEAGLGIEPARPGSGARARRADAVDMARRPQGLGPGVADQGASALPAEMAVPTLDKRLAGGVAQPRHEGPRVGEAERGEGVWPGKNARAIGPRQPRGCAVLAPLHLGKGLTLRAGAMAAGVRRVPLEPTGGTVCGVPATLGGPARLTVTHSFLLQGGHGLGPAGGLSREAEASGAVPRWGAGLAPLWRAWAVRGVRRHRAPPAWAGGGLRRGGGRTGGGPSPEAAGGSGGPAWWCRATDGPAASGSSGRRRRLRGGGSPNRVAASGSLDRA